MYFIFILVPSNKMQYVIKTLFLSQWNLAAWTFGKIILTFHWCRKCWWFSHVPQLQVNIVSAANFVVNAMVLAILTCFLDIASTERKSTISFSSSLVKWMVWLRRFSHPCQITFMFHLLSLSLHEVIRRPEDSFLILSKMPTIIRVRKMLLLVPCSPKCPLLGWGGW